jgi:hypothetical protein
MRARSVVGGWGTILQEGKSRVRGPMMFAVYLILPAEIGPDVYSASNRKWVPETEMFLWSKSPPARTADNLTTICEPIF